MTLEYFRQDPIGRMYFAIGDRSKQLSKSNSIQSNYPDYALRAFYLCLQDIQELEYAKGDIVKAGRNAIVASTFWFLCLEAYISTLLKLTCLLTGKSFKPHGSKKPAEKLSVLFDLLDIDSVKIKQSGLYSRVNEFATFRNEIFHDRNAGDVVQFNKTWFCPVPIQCNLVDTLQGLLILLETTHLLRYAVSGLDTMPDILIHEQNKVFHKKLDFLYEEVIKPSVKGILEKHQLVTNLNLDQHFPAPVRSTLFDGHEAAAYCIADSPESFKFQLNPKVTDISYSLFQNMVSKHDIAPGKFDMGTYTLNK